MNAPLIGLADEPLRWDRLHRLRPSAGLEYEKHDGAPGRFEGVPGLAIRYADRPAEGPAVVVDRVVLAGPGLEPLIARLMGAGAWWLGAETAVELPDLARVEESCAVFDEDERSILVARPSEGSLAALLRARAGYRDHLRLDGFLPHADRLATPLGSVPGAVALYQRHGGGLREAVLGEAGHMGIEISWRTAAEPVAADPGLPSLGDLPVERGPVLDLSGYNLAQLPDRCDAVELVLDRTAVVDVEPLAGWSALRRLSLRGLQVRSLAPVRQVERLVIERPTEGLLRDLAGAGVEELVLIGGQLTNLGALADLPRLRSLSLEGTELGSFGGLPERLRSLGYGGRAPPDLSPLGELAELESLSLRASGPLDARVLSQLTRLEVLELAGDAGLGATVDSLEVLASLPRLASLSMRLRGVSEVPWVSSLTSLRTLGIAAPLESLPELRRLGSLERLDLSGSDVSSLSGLSDLPALRSLDLSGAGAAIERVEWAALARLEVLVARGASLPDLEPLAPLTALRELEVGDCRVSSLRGVERMVSLRSLGAGMGLLEDVEPLRGHPSLARLDLSWSRVSSVEPLSSLRALSSLELSRTEVRDLSPLAALPLRELALGHLEVDVGLLFGGALRSTLGRLSLDGARVSSFAALNGSALRSLSLQSARFDCDAALSLPELRSLDLSLTDLPTFERLAGLTKLRELHVQHLVRRLDHAPLLALPPLARLEAERGRVPEPLRRALALRHHLVLRGE